MILALVLHGGWTTMNGSANRAAFLLGPALALAACSSPLADYSGYVAPRPYVVDCNKAWQYAASALKANGFTITEVRRDGEGGYVTGTRSSEAMKVAVFCDAEGVHITPSGLTPYAQNGLRIAFERVMATDRAPRPAPVGLQVSVDLITGPESALYFPGGLESSSLVAARFHVANGGSRAAKLVTESIRLRATSGARQPPIDRSDLQRRLPALAPEIVPHLLASGVLAGGQRAEGFLMFPADHYEGAFVPLIDVDTGESEEFDVGFP